jgi:intein-encoded DNA endonuclease-like protein
MPIQKIKNENFFKQWSPEMAYVLGFFVADGCMIKNSRGAHFIEFHITDRNILVKIRKALNSNHKISVRKTRDAWKTAYRLQIGSKIMFEDLISLGMMPRKSNTVKLPKVPKKYFHHFVRGYFDGDGNVCTPKYKRANRGDKLSTTLLAGFTSGSREFLEKLHINLKKLAGIFGGTLYNRDGAFRLHYSVNDSKKLYDFMYKQSDSLFLSRKKVVFEKYILKTKQGIL